MKDPADDQTGELPVLSALEKAYRDSYGALGGLIARVEAAQADPVEGELTPEEFVRRARAAQQAIDSTLGPRPRPKRGVSKNASKSADKPERRGR